MYDVFLHMMEFQALKHMTPGQRSKYFTLKAKRLADQLLADAVKKSKRRWWKPWSYLC